MLKILRLVITCDMLAQFKFNNKKKKNVDKTPEKSR